MRSWAIADAVEAVVDCCIARVCAAEGGEKGLLVVGIAREIGEDNTRECITTRRRANVLEMAAAMENRTVQGTKGNF
jgi:hypothetical protein